VQGKELQRVSESMGRRKRLGEERARKALFALTFERGISPDLPILRQDDSTLPSRLLGLQFFFSW